MARVTEAGINRVSNAAQKVIPTVNKVINPIASMVTTEGKLMPGYPQERHLPSANYAGPGTAYAARKARGDVGTTDVDRAAMSHDHAYETMRAKVKKGEIDQKDADRILKQADINLMNAADASKRRSPLEALHSRLVSAAMRAKIAADTARGKVSYAGGESNMAGTGKRKKATGMTLLQQEAARLSKAQASVDKELRGSGPPPQKEGERIFRLRQIANGQAGDGWVPDLAMFKNIKW